MEKTLDNIFDLSGKTILVTGASSGLGRHFATAMAEAGATIVGAARRLDALAELAAEIKGKGGAAHAVTMDVTDMESVRAGVAEAVRLTGGIDGLIANSGIARRSVLLDRDEAGWDETIATNLKGVWAVGTEVAHHMVERGKGGSIVNIASLLSFRQSAGNTAYAVSKAAVVQLTQQMALEWAEHRIRVNALAPGYFETDINRAFLATEAGRKIAARIPMGRVGEHHELTGPMLLLLSDAGSFMTSSIVSVDGGHRVNSI
jgi:NAD(P)-dependent dehydrogenase (short-subunit alcohol dehydrogenase family)